MQHADLLTKVISNVHKPLSVDPGVDILLATYNGQSYLGQLLLSLTQQSHTNWQLLVSDDNSSDGTAVLLNNFSKLNPEKVTILPRNQQSLGACQNFARLIRESRQDYIMFCDQDDVWLPDKIALTLKKILEAEANKGKNFPMMVFTDLVLTDSRNNEIAKSFWKYEHIDPNRVELKNLLVQNVSTGCTIMSNRALIDIVNVMPQAAIVHDWWLALLASSFGALIPLGSQTMHYRQHEGNCIGASRWSLLNKVRDIVTLSKFIKTYRATFNLTYAQTDSFLSLYRNNLTSDQIDILTKYVKLASSPWLGKRVSIVNNRFFRYGLVRKFAQFLFM